MWSPDMVIGMARALTGIATARATMNERNARATGCAMAEKVTSVYGHFKQRARQPQRPQCARAASARKPGMSAPDSAMGYLMTGFGRTLPWAGHSRIGGSGSTP